MCYFLRPPNTTGSFVDRRNAPKVLSTRREDGRMIFVHHAPIVMHDDCAEENGCGGSPDNPGREGFCELPGWDLCWWPGGYSDKPDSAPCYWCAVPVVTARRAEAACA